MAVVSPVPSSTSAQKMEQPLSAGERSRLILGATGVALLFYLLTVSVVFVLSVYILAGVVLAVFAARVGMHAVIARGLNAQGKLIGAMVRSLWGQRGPEWNIVLTEPDAPRLFRMLQEVAARVGVAPPDRVELQMPQNAGVMLKGYRTGRGHCTLSVGYDLLASLDEREAEAVMAHELAHARTIQRGYSGVVNSALGRMIRCASNIRGLVHECRAEKSRFLTAEVLQRWYEGLAKWGVRLMAAYQRQEEFIADRGAAEVTDVSVYRAALLKTHVAAYRAARLHWRERMVQMQRGGDFNAWLQARLSPTTDEERRELESRALAECDRGEFDTHPVLADRLAALPVPDRSEIPASAPSALHLLQDPGRLAEELVGHLDRTADAEEQKAAAEILKKLRERHRSYRRGSFRMLGWVVLVIGVFFGGLLACLPQSDQESRDIVNVIVGLLGAGAAMGGWLLWFTRQQPASLPVPPFSRWQARMETSIEQPEGGMTSAPPPPSVPTEVKGRKATAAYLLDQASSALEACDFPRAQAAAEQALQSARRSLPALLQRAMGAAGQQDGKTSSTDAGEALKRSGLGPDVSWATGWTFLCLGEWHYAEAYLLDAVQRRPAESGIWLYLAYAQWRAGRIYAAMRSARQALELDPRESPVLLARILLSAGRPVDAERELQSRPVTDDDRYHALLCAVRCHSLMKRETEAAQAAQEFTAAFPGDRPRLVLARCLVEAERNEEARQEYHQLLESGFYPEALLALARMASKAKEIRQAWDYLAAALSLHRKAPAGVMTQMDILEAACDLTLTLQEPCPNLSAWIATVDLRGTAAPIPSLKLLICAENEGMAREHVRWLYQSLLGAEALDTGKVRLEELPPEKRPASPVSPGIHRIGVG